MIEDILPQTAVIECAHADATADPRDGLFPQEAELVARAVAKRQREFATVRACARRAFTRLGVPPSPVLPNKRGAPQWPDGIVGSMTHCDGYRAAALARTTEASAIGIDAEPDGPLPEGVFDAISLDTERARTPGLAAAVPDLHWERLLFSAKESVFKTWYPLTGLELDFSEADITLDAAGTFSARLLVPGPVLGGERLQSFSGRWLARDGLLATAIFLPATVPSTIPSPRSGSGTVPAPDAGM